MNSLISASSQFQSTSPARGTTEGQFTKRLFTERISIHVPREGDDVILWAMVEVLTYFNPRPPRGGRHIWPGCGRSGGRISIHVPREGDDNSIIQRFAHSRISIHVPREGDDACPLRPPVRAPLISIHVPREGDDATGDQGAASATGISIHVPREGDDPSRSPGRGSLYDFNPRPPRGGRRGSAVWCPFDQEISIHVPREGDDPRPRNLRDDAFLISIHVPREGDDFSCPSRHARLLQFQSTSPARGTTS